MIKIRYLITVILFAFSVFGLFQVKFKVQNLHREAAELQKQLEHEKNSIYVLKAEWAYLNQPERLQRLATKYLNLSEVKSSQIMLARPGSIIIAQVQETTNIIATETESQFIKTSMASSPHKMRPVKWRYKERPDMRTKK